MKQTITLLAIIITFTLFHLTACAQKEEVIIGKTFPDHPRIIMLEGEEDRIRSILVTDATFKNVHDIILNECNSLLSKPPVERILIGRRLLDKSREALRRIFDLSYAYRMTESKKYLDRAEKEMLAIAAFSDWNPSHFLDVAEMTMAMAIGYDWLYNYLPEKSRKVIKDAILTKGLNPSLDAKYNSWLKASHNWNQVCNAGITFGALAIYEEETDLATMLIKRAEESIKLPMEEYQPDGAYPEGYGYWGYGTSFNVMFISAWEKAFNKKFEVPQNEGFLKTSSYMVNMTGPTGSCFNYADNSSGAGLHPAMFWLADRINEKTVLYAENGFLANLKSAGDRLLPAIIIWNAGKSTSSISPPERRIWIGQGKSPVALMRSKWADPYALFVGFKGGSPKVNHAHMDVGSFVMESEGVRWAMDFGAQDYNSLEQKGVNLWSMVQNSQRWEVFRYNNFVHNTLTVNSQLQRVDGNATITGYSDDQDFLSAVSDLTTIYNDQLLSSKRGIAVSDNRYVVVRDEVETKGTGSVIRWTMLTSATATITGTNTIELAKNGKTLIIKVSDPGVVTMKTWSTEPTHDYDAPNPGTTLVGFETTIPANTRAALQVYLVPGNTSPDQVANPGPLSSWPLKK